MLLHQGLFIIVYLLFGLLFLTARHHVSHLVLWLHDTYLTVVMNHVMVVREFRVCLADAKIASISTVVDICGWVSCVSDSILTEHRRSNLRLLSSVSFSVRVEWDRTVSAWLLKLPSI